MFGGPNPGVGTVVGTVTAPYHLYNYFSANGVSWCSTKNLLLGGFNSFMDGLTSGDPVRFGESFGTALIVAGTAGAGFAEAPVAAGGAARELSLGLNDGLQLERFSNHYGLSDFTTLNLQSPGEVLGAMNSAKNIHFLMDGFDWAHYESWVAGGANPARSFTNWEMHQILNNPTLYNKTWWWTGPVP